MAVYSPTSSREEQVVTADDTNEVIADPNDIAIDMCASNSTVTSSQYNVHSESDSGEKTRDISQNMRAYSNEEVFAHHTSSGSDKELDKFNFAIGVIEDLLVSDGFAELQNKFFGRFYSSFEYGEENKLSYMDIFQQYQSSLERTIEQELQSQVAGFSMDWMSKMLSTHQDCVDMGVIEILNSLTDFLTFKDLILGFKEEKEGKGIDLSDLIMTSSLST
eukprot:TRINITY_DN19269_c0_g1_i1.p1 TRINITY_DN19269_c0_g1~~TRINITY_DN19269_c0_g1_i1.p1  ORF type:complete len:219 (+),score=39.95 TRINITY_DN19269_c0_g1_i1:43-699(+)